MEKEGGIINFLERKKKKEAKTKGDEHYETGKFYEFGENVPIWFPPDNKNIMESAGVPIPDELPPGKYECLGFDERGKQYKFWGKPIGEEEEMEVFVDANTIRESH